MTVVDSASVIDNAKKALKELLERQDNQENADQGVLPLFEDEDKTFYITIRGHQRERASIKTFSIALPNQVSQNKVDACIICPNNQESTINSVLDKVGVQAKVVPIKTLKKEYERYESKRILRDSYDIFFSTKDLHRDLIQGLGSTFYSKGGCKTPLLIKDFTSSKFSSYLNSLDKITVYKPKANFEPYSIKIGTITNSYEQLSQNIETILSELTKAYKNGEIIDLSVGSTHSKALPIYSKIGQSIKKQKIMHDKEEMKKKEDLLKKKQQEIEEKKSVAKKEAPKKQQDTKKDEKMEIDSKPATTTTTDKKSKQTPVKAAAPKDVPVETPSKSTTTKSTTTATTKSTPAKTAAPKDVPVETPSKVAPKETPSKQVKSTPAKTAPKVEAPVETPSKPTTTKTTKTTTAPVKETPVETPSKVAPKETPSKQVKSTPAKTAPKVEAPVETPSKVAPKETPSKTATKETVKEQTPSKKLAGTKRKI